ncbi:hypothetical protein [Kineosporia sp. R_H_3]|uniref:hypothetical protein n=1 Tax=Kineosporia sp. R_H_3 TaxID=1961848 RepID=UPI000B4B4A6B|nr:hypothetical protein [Kineosporia sp. R_H_3]
MVPTHAAGQPIGLEAILNSLGTVFFSVVVALAAGLLVLAFLGERAATGTPSWVSRVSARLATRTGGPLWEPFPLAVALTGLAVALGGWRAADAGGPLAGAGTMGLALGLAVALLGGVMASALAHPPAKVERHADDVIAHPLPARTTFGHRRVLPGAFGSGPVGAVAVLVGGIVALVGLPVAALWRALEGRSLGDGVLAAQAPLLVAVTAMAAGAWLLRAESRNAVAAARGVAVRPRDLRETAGAAAVLLALSVAADLDAPVLVLGLAAGAALVVARARLGIGGAVLVVAAYAGARVAVAAVTGTLTSGPIVPYVVPALLGAAAVEVALVLLGDRVLGVPAARREQPVGAPAEEPVNGPGRP